MTPFEEAALEMEAIEDRDQALVLVRFFESVRAFVTSPGALGPDAAVPKGLDDQQSWLYEFLRKFRNDVTAHPHQHLEAIVSLDVWLARMRARWQVGDHE